MDGRLNLVIGAPVCQRAWILPRWLHLLRNLDIDHARTALLFAYGVPEGEEDDGTLELLRQEEGSWASVEVIHDDDGGHRRERVWDFSRYATMVRLRNRLLARVRELGPRHYLSCDTDMLLQKATVSVLIQEMERHFCDGIAPLTWMTESGTEIVNAMTVGGGRPPIPVGTVQVDACFGVVLMNERLYQVDYRLHHFGEDIGWAEAAREADCKLCLTGRVRVKHVMRRERLHVVDDRVGY